MCCLTTLFCQQIDNDLSISRNVPSNKMIHAIVALVFLIKANMFFANYRVLILNFEQIFS